MHSKIGRGLEDLLLENNINVDEILDGEVISNICLTEIKPNPYQPRKIFNEEKIDELAASISKNGVFQPIIVKKVNDYYIIVSGERRYRACKKLGLEKIPAIVRNYDESKVAEIALVENLQREDLTPMEEAEAYAHIMKSLGMTQNDLAIKIGKSRSHITNMLGLLNLPDEVARLVSDGTISMGHARTLSKLEDPKRIIELANRIVKKSLTVREIEELAKNEKKANVIKRVDKKYASIEKKISKKLNCKVKIDENKISIKVDDETRDLIIKLLMEEYDV